MTSDQASDGLKHEYCHLQDQHHDPFQMTRPIVRTFYHIVVSAWTEKHKHNFNIPILIHVILHMQIFTLAFKTIIYLLHCTGWASV